MKKSQPVETEQPPSPAPPRPPGIKEIGLKQRPPGWGPVLHSEFEPGLSVVEEKRK